MKILAFITRSKIVLFTTIIFLSLVFSPSFIMAQSQQTTFTTAEAAADKLYNIVSTSDRASVAALFGTEYLYLLPLDDIDEQDRMHFTSAWKDTYKLVPGEHKEIIIEVGPGGWQFPIPLVKGAEGWYFDTTAGAEVVKTRSIGRNEMSTMQAVLAYYDAQNDYSEQDRNGDGILEFAQKFTSTDGKQDGLYWVVQPGEALSPLGSLFTSKKSEGAYYGYHFKILKQQGNSARRGAFSYMSGERMRYGFALVAWPAEYGNTGVMSFLINHDGIIYEKDLGLETDKVIEKMDSFNPSEGWVQVKESLWFSNKKDNKKDTHE